MLGVALRFLLFFFFNATATTEIYTLSLHDALPICNLIRISLTTTMLPDAQRSSRVRASRRSFHPRPRDRKSTRLNSSHANISYAVFCLKKKNTSNRRLGYGGRAVRAPWRSPARKET